MERLLASYSACIVAYAFSPIDLIPDFISILGYLDDVILVPLGVMLALKMMPKTTEMVNFFIKEDEMDMKLLFQREISYPFFICDEKCISYTIFPHPLEPSYLDTKSGKLR
ncbi:YkvA family protein [Ammoniphilus resinae]|uniref:DUF1232 domain-containing protein n=1 Tax=Ammoniphilus resinae TaxID=861532 RepID=A0ABS4GW62_9BACL|nr:hypothetical protein [Ammoniphilus resinae]